MGEQILGRQEVPTSPKKWWPVWLSIPVFLALVLIPLFAVYFAYDAGIQPGLSLLVVTIVLTGVLTVGEYLFGRGARKGMLNHTDLAAFFFGGILTGGVLNGFTTVLLAPLSSAVSSALNTAFWPSGWPLWLQVILGAAISDVVMWPIHRYMHKQDGLWRVHVIHHSVKDLRPVRAFMQHPFEVFFLGVIPAIPLIVLGAPSITIVLVGTLRVVVGITDHATMPLKTGWLDWVVHTPNDHWWHHNLEDSGGSNFTTVVIPIDVAFRSFTKPPTIDPVPELIGIRSPEIAPNKYLNLLAVPFRWKRIMSEGHS